MTGLGLWERSFLAHHSHGRGPSSIRGGVCLGGSEFAWDMCRCPRRKYLESVEARKLNFRKEGWARLAWEGLSGSEEVGVDKHILGYFVEQHFFFKILLTVELIVIPP